MTNSKTIVFCMAVVVTVFVSCTFAFAEEPPQPQTQPSNWEKFANHADMQLGAGVIISDQPYVGGGTRTYVVPVGHIKYKKLFFEGIRLGYTVYNNNNFKIAPILKWRFDGYDEKDSSALSGMANRYSSLDAGVQVKYRTPYGSLRATWVIDILSNSNGQEVDLGYSKRFARAFGLEKLSVIPGAGVSFYNDKLANYYFGVRPSEARAGRPAYSPNCSFNFYANIRADYQLTEKWSLFGGVFYTLYDSDIKNSPIVDQDGKLSFMAGAMYKF